MNRRILRSRTLACTLSAKAKLVVFYLIESYPPIGFGVLPQFEEIRAMCSLTEDSEVKEILELLIRDGRLEVALLENSLDFAYRLPEAV